MPTRFLSYPMERRFVACSQLPGAIDLSAWLGGIDHVTVSGETGREARVYNYNWVLVIREQCAAAEITFWFMSAGSLFRRDGVTQKVNPYKQGSFAKEHNITISGGKKLY